MRPVLLAVLFALCCSPSSACPIRLLDVAPEDELVESAGEGLTLVEGGLRYLERQASPIYVVPVLGVYRGGKSLLLNRIMGLTAPYNDGFSVGHDQSTHTRGVDVCAEAIDGLGTVVWMDTEGLWSSEYTRGAHGTKIFNLALLLASSVLLNSVKVLSDQFFDFFAEEQQVARILKRGLSEGGIPTDALLPSGLRIFWILQQPINYNGTDAVDDVGGGGGGGGGVAATAFDAFLRRPNDELRERVRSDFSHRMHEVPMAVHDARRWDHLDRLPEDELLPEYVACSRRLRAAVLEQLREARPLQSNTIASQIRLYLDLVRTRQFSTKLAKEAFEEAEIVSICDSFAEKVCNITGPLPVESLSLGRACNDVRDDMKQRGALAAETYHLDEAWTQRLQQCLTEKEVDVRRQNSEKIMTNWRAAADTASEGGSCFFLGKLLAVREEYSAVYRDDFGRRYQEQATDYARRLQRTRLVECVRLRDIFLPFSPLLVWIFCRAYLHGGTPSDLGTMLFHGLIILGSYSFFQMTNQLPPNLDLDYPILKENKVLLDAIMRAPPSVPWATLVYLIQAVGTAWAVWKIATYLAWMYRPAGHGREVQQMVNLELKVNELRKFSDAMIHDRILTGAIKASSCIAQNDARGAFLALLTALNFFCDLGEGDLTRQHLGVAPGFTTVVKKVLRESQRKLPTRGQEMGNKVHDNRLDELVASADIPKLLQEMNGIMMLLSK